MHEINRRDMLRSTILLLSFARRGQAQWCPTVRPVHEDNSYRMDSLGFTYQLLTCYLAGGIFARTGYALPKV